MKTPTSCWIALVLMLAAAGGAADDPVQEEWQWNEYARGQFEAGNYAEAAEAFERADTLIPTADSATNAAIGYIWGGQCESAWNALRRLIDRSEEIRQNPGVRRVVLTRGRESDAPDWRRCALANRLVRAIDLARGLPVADDAPEVDARGFAALAERYYNEHWYSDAALLYQMSYDLYPIDEALYNAAMALHSAGRHRQATDAFRRLIQGHSDLRSSETVAEALRAATTADEPSEVEACVLFSRLRRAIADQAGESVTDVGEARRLFMLGVEQYGRDQYHVAAVTFECCHTVVAHPRVMLNAARCRRDAGEWRPALEAIDRYLEGMPEVAADPAVIRARRALDREPYATDERAWSLFERLTWAIERIDPPPDEGSGGSR